MMYYRISKNEKNLFFGKKIAQVWAVTLNTRQASHFIYVSPTRLINSLEHIDPILKKKCSTINHMENAGKATHCKTDHNIYVQVVPSSTAVLYTIRLYCFSYWLNWAENGSMERCLTWDRRVSS